METKLLNKLSLESREDIIRIEGRLRELDEELFEVNLMLKELQDGQKLL